MRSSRLAALAVAAGTALLAWSTAGVTGISAPVPTSATTAAPLTRTDGRFVSEHGRHGDQEADGDHHGHREV